VNASDLEALRNIFPDAAVLTSLDVSDSNTDTATESEDETPGLPEPLTALYDPTTKSLSQEELGQRCKSALQSLQRSTQKQNVDQLEYVTRQQSECQAWHTHRAGRITASIFHRASSLRDSTDRSNIVSTIMQYNKDDLNVSSVQWGRRMEDTAREAYKAVMQKQHTNFKIRPSGLVVKEERPYLAASPDGTTSCDCCGSGVLEIKCPSKYQDNFEGFQQDARFHLDTDKKLKVSHPYYSQIQLQMYVCGVQFCDFFTWTRSENVVQRIWYDKQDMSQKLKKVSELFVSYVLPELLTRKSDPSIIQDTFCSKCERPSFGKMITCITCQLAFHYECVNIRRAVKNWKCVTCRSS